MSHLKDTTDFVNFIERTTLPKDVILVSMDVTSLYTNIPQEEGVNIVCTAYENFYRDGPSIPKCSLKKVLKLILQENSFQFIERNYLQTHGTAMGTKMAVALAISYPEPSLPLSSGTGNGRPGRIQNRNHQILVPV